MVYASPVVMVSSSVMSDSGNTSHQDHSGGCCSKSASDDLKFLRALIFSAPIFFTFILLILFYALYLRRLRLDWPSFPFRTSLHAAHNISTLELGLKKEMREMLPIVVFKESFFVRETECSVCLSEYQAEDRLQQIPACGHTFHVDCINSWLTTHTTCPLCRLSLLPQAGPFRDPNMMAEGSYRFSGTETAIESSDEIRLSSMEGHQGS